jgi:hypothetical protein
MKLQRQRPDDFKAKLEPSCRNEPENKCKTALNSYLTPNIPSIYSSKNYNVQNCLSWRIHTWFADGTQV